MTLGVCVAHIMVCVAHIMVCVAHIMRHSPIYLNDVQKLIITVFFVHSKLLIYCFIT